MDDEQELAEQQKKDDDRKSVVGQNHTTTSTTSSVRSNTFGHRGPSNISNALRGTRSGGSHPGGLGGPMGPVGPRGGLGYLYVLMFMFVAIAGATVMTGGAAPIDPNGPGGPPTLPPYFSTEGEEQQQLIIPSSTNKKDQLQLKTFLINTCGQTVAIDFLLDVSGSMKLDDKMGKMKTALQAFTGKLGGTSAIAIQTFSAETIDRVPFDYYRNNKPKVNATIASLRPDGYTSTRDGLTMARDKLGAAIEANKFPGYKYYLILMTDGVPETPSHTGCLVTVPDDNIRERCFAKDQDPRGPPNISSEIKAMGVTVYSIGIYSQSGSDKQLEPYLEALLKDVATDDAHYFSSPNASNLSTVLGSILKDICVPITEQKTETVPAPTT